MTKTSTIQFKVNSLASKLNGEITDLGSVFNLEEEFGDVYNFLNEFDLNVDQMVVDKILALASQMDE
jgi:hypothetical protein